MTPRERIVELLKSYPYAVVCETASARGMGRTQNGTIEPRFPDLYYDGSYAELVRCLGGMKVAEPSLHWHVTRRYVCAEVLPMVVPVRRTRWGAVPVLAPYIELAGGLPGHTGRTCRVLVRRWDHRVDEAKVQQAVRWLERRMYGGNTRRIDVPKVLLAEMAA